MSMQPIEQENYATIRLKHNSASWQLYCGNDYVGSISLDDLCQLLQLTFLIGTNKALAQMNAIAEQDSEKVAGTNEGDCA